MRDFAETLAGIRQHKGLNPRQLALRSGLSPAMVSRLESGQRGPSRETIGALITGLGLGFGEDDVQDRVRLFLAAGYIPDGHIVTALHKMPEYGALDERASA